LYGLIVDTDQWIPKGVRATVLVRSKVSDIMEHREWFEQRVEEFAEPLVIMERIRFLDSAGSNGVMLVKDQLAFLDTTLTQVRNAEGQVLFPDMSTPYFEEWNSRIVGISAKLALKARAGWVAGLRAPELLTPAERAALRELGVDAVCRWIHLETRWAAARGRKVLGIGVGDAVAERQLRDLVGSIFESEEDRKGTAPAAPRSETGKTA
jgi:hypothetical protein